MALTASEVIFAHADQSSARVVQGRLGVTHVALGRDGTWLLSGSVLAIKPLIGEV